MPGTMNSVYALGISETFIRLAVATLAGAALGLNRELKGKPAGLRTHAMVTLGAALASVTIIYATAPETDPNALSRVVQGIITGIGFIGAGVILRDAAGRRVRGLTTAATIWVAASLGVACGVGYWSAVAAATLLTLAVLVLGGRIELLATRIFGAGDEDDS